MDFILSHFTYCHQGRNARLASPLLLITLTTLLALGPAFTNEDTLTSDSSQNPQEHKLSKTSQGPWGTIEYYYFYLEASEFLVSKFRLPNTNTRWAFRAEQIKELPDMLAQFGLNDEMIQLLLNPRRLVTERGNLYLFPTQGEIESISSEARSKLYAELAKHPANRFYESPVLFVGDTVEEWAEDSGLPSRIIAKIKELTYRRGGTLAFSDVPLLLGMAQSDSEARMIFRKMTRVRTLLARLSIAKDENIPKLMDYWTIGLGLRRKEIEPILTAAKRMENVSSLDLLHMLPPLPRKLLYTFVDPEQATLGRFPDCHWTSLNFFNYEPENYYLDTRLATSAVLENFTPVEPPYRYGDVLMFMDRDNNAVHSCTYLAADIVFTKNGANITTPWILLQLDDLKKMYPQEDGVVRITGYRHRM